MDSEATGEIVVAIDTSGSIDSEMLAQFGGELQAIVDEVRPRQTRVLYCDTRVTSCQEYEPGETIELSVKGRGGTAFTPVFDHVSENMDDLPKCLVFLTDLLCHDYPDEPEYPTLWVATDRYWIEYPECQPPFGDVIQLE
jgi:predicted metal-dependent peptidase